MPASPLETQPLPLSPGADGVDAAIADAVSAMIEEERAAAQADSRLVPEGQASATPATTRPSSPAPAGETASATPATSGLSSPTAASNVESAANQASVSAGTSLQDAGADGADPDQKRDHGVEPKGRSGPGLKRGKSGVCADAGTTPKQGKKDKGTAPGAGDHSPKQAIQETLAMFMMHSCRRSALSAS